ncbi:MAG: outer membrane protein assembly factor BamE [Oceanicoccus sp.]|jgi:outer membrane protein assembly factor BamE
MYKNLVILSIFFLSACSSLEFPGVYKINVEQGNVVTQEMVDQLKPGMSRDQVEYIMGSALIHDTFSENRWDYVYTSQRGDGEKHQKRISIFFENDKLQSFTGDFVPTEKTESEPESEQTPATNEPKD